MADLVSDRHPSVAVLDQGGECRWQLEETMVCEQPKRPCVTPAGNKRICPPPNGLSGVVVPPVFRGTSAFIQVVLEGHVLKQTAQDKESSQMSIERFSKQDL